MSAPKNEENYTEFMFNLSTFSTLIQVQNGATFVSVDKIDIAKDNSPALLFQGVVSVCLAITIFWNDMWCHEKKRKEKLEMVVMLSVQMMAVEWIPKVCANA